MLTALAETWKRHHREWDYHLWRDTDSRQFVAAHFPELLLTYDSYPHAIQRVDALRYCLLHHFGGVYVDLDIECLRPIEGLLGSHDMVLTFEPPTHAEDKGLKHLISNAFIAARPGHPFLSEVLNELVTGSNLGLELPAEFPAVVFSTTGPTMLSRVHGRRWRPDVCVLDHRAVAPLKFDAASLQSVVAADQHALPIKLSCIRDGAYAIHYWANSWLPINNVFYNPHPHDIQGFTFYPKRDSLGFDIRFAGRNVPEVAESCLNCTGAVAFNTDGFLKCRIRPKWRWDSWRDRAENEGLYVKLSASSRPLWPLIGLGHSEPA